MTDKARELLERAADSLDGGLLYRLRLKEEIRAYLAEPEPTQEPIGYVITIDPDKSYRKDSWVPWKEVEGMNGGKIRDDIPDGSFVYLHPAPRKSFVRLTDEEITEIIGPYSMGTVGGYTRKLFDTIQDVLEEKNK